MSGRAGGRAARRDVAGRWMCAGRAPIARESRRSSASARRRRRARRRPRRLVDGVAAHRDARDEQHEEESGVGADDEQPGNEAERPARRRARARSSSSSAWRARWSSFARTAPSVVATPRWASAPAAAQVATAGGARSTRSEQWTRRTPPWTAPTYDAALADVDAALAEQRARHRALARRAQLGRGASRPAHSSAAAPSSPTPSSVSHATSHAQSTGSAARSPPVALAGGSGASSLSARPRGAAAGGSQVVNSGRWRGWRERCDAHTALRRN